MHLPSSASIGPPSPIMATSEASEPGQLSLLTSFAEDFPVRTSATQASERELTAQGQDYGASTPELLASFDPATSSWRTSQLCLDGDLSEFSETWPRSGLMLSGIAYRLPPLVPLTAATDSGSWPTPNVPNGGRSVAHVKDWRGRSAYYNGKKVQVGLESAVRMWPTPTSDACIGIVPTQKMAERFRRKGSSGSFVEAMAARMWPTPSAEDNRDRGNLSTPSVQRRQSLGKQLMLSMVVDANSGALNPTWVEWLMGFPLGWTALDASATPSSRKSRKSSAGRSSTQK